VSQQRADLLADGRVVDGRRFRCSRRLGDAAGVRVDNEEVGDSSGRIQGRLVGRARQRFVPIALPGTLAELRAHRASFATGEHQALAGHSRVEHTPRLKFSADLA
jgi:hypothetical protein